MLIVVVGKKGNDKLCDASNYVYFWTYLALGFKMIIISNVLMLDG